MLDFCKGFLAFLQSLRRQLYFLPSFVKAFLSRRRAGYAITFYGFYGASDTSSLRNIGDNAILIAMLRSLSDIPDKKQIVVTDCEGVYSQYGEEFCVGLGARDLPKWIPIIDRTKVLVLGGGGLFQDYGIARLTPFLLFRLLFLFWIAGRKVMWYSVGIGPLLTKQGQLFTYLSARLADIISVRDYESEELLAKIGVPRKNLYVTSDPAVMLSVPSVQIVTKTHRNRLGLSVLPIYRSVFCDAKKNKQLENTLVQFVQSILNEGWCVRLFSFHDGPDTPFCRDIAACLNNENVRIVGPSMNVEQVLSEYSSLDFFLGMRYHSVIFSFIACVPAGAIIYHPKVRSLMKNAQLGDYAVELDGVTVARLKSILTRLENDNVVVVEKMQRWLSEQRTKLDRNRVLLEGLVKDGTP